MTDVKDEELVESVNQIIDNGDLDTLTFKQIFQQLEDKYKGSLKEKRNFLRTTVQQIIEKKQDKEDDEVNVETVDEPKEEKGEEKEEEEVDVEGGTEEKPKEDEIQGSR
jgi:hypothetical protein